MTGARTAVTILNKVESKEKWPSFNHTIAEQDTPRGDRPPVQRDLGLFAFPLLPGNRP